MPIGDDEDLKYRVTLDTDDYVAGQNRIENETRSTNRNIRRGTDASTSAYERLGSRIRTLAIAGGALFLLKKAIGGIINVSKASLRLFGKQEIALKGLSKVAQAYGQNTLEATDAAKKLAEDGLIPITATAQTLKNLISTGFSVTEALNMAEALKDIGAFNKITDDLGQAMIDSSKGIKTNSIELTENIGLTQRMASVMKTAGVSIKNGIDLTNNLAQRTAFYNSVLKEQNKFQGNAAELANTYAGSVSKLQTAQTKFYNMLGKVFQPIATATNETMTRFLNVFSGANEEVKKGAKELKPLVERYAELEKTTSKTAEAEEELKTIMNEISTISPDLVTGYDEQGNAIINLANATIALNKANALTLIDRRNQINKEKRDVKKGLDGQISDLKRFKAMRARLQSDVDPYTDDDKKAMEKINKKIRETTLVVNQYEKQKKLLAEEQAEINKILHGTPKEVASKRMTQLKTDAAEEERIFISRTGYVEANENKVWELRQKYFEKEKQNSIMLNNQRKDAQADELENENYFQQKVLELIWTSEEKRIAQKIMINEQRKISAEKEVAENIDFVRKSEADRVAFLTQAVIDEDDSYNEYMNARTESKEKELDADAKLKEKKLEIDRKFASLSNAVAQEIMKGGAKNLGDLKKLVADQVRISGEGKVIELTTEGITNTVFAASNLAAGNYKQAASFGAAAAKSFGGAALVAALTGGASKALGGGSSSGGTTTEQNNDTVNQSQNIESQANAKPTLSIDIRDSDLLPALIPQLDQALKDEWNVSIINK